MARLRTKKAAVAVAPAEVEITTFKGFNRDLTCRDFRFEVGKTFELPGEIKACSYGFHACEHPLNCFEYYAPATSRFFEVKQGGALSRHGADTKVASARITIGVELSLGDMVQRAVKWVFDRSKPEGKAATGDLGAASATGDQGAASATGDLGAASATGDQGAASATGDLGAASATGDLGAASATGYQGAASATGDLGAASATGYQGAASATGYQGAASATGEHAVACALGFQGRAMAGETGAIVVVSRDPNTGAILRIFAGKVGEHGIKPNTFYTLSDDGQPVEVL